MANTYFFKINGEKRLDYEFNKPEHSKEEKQLIKLSQREGWELKPLRELCVSIHRGKGSSIYTIEGIPILKVRNLHNEYIDFETDFVLRTWYEKNKKKIKIEKNDILLASTGVGTIGKVDIFQEKMDIAVDGHITIIRVKEEYNPRYVLHYLRSRIGYNQIERFTTGCTGQTELNYKHVENFNILIPKNKTIQDKIVAHVEEYIEKSYSSFKHFKEVVIKLKKIIDDICSIQHKIFQNFFILSSEKIKDRIDCYFNHPEREYLVKQLEKLNSPDVEIIMGNTLEIIKPINKKSFNENKINIFKYLDIGNTEKELGNIKGFKEDILLNLPTRAKQQVKTNDILQPRPIGSTEGTIIVNKEFNEQLVSTGFIQIRPQNYEKTAVLWLALKSEMVQKQMFYLQAGSIQPEITPNNFKNNVLIPIPKDKIKGDILENMEKDLKEARENMKDYQDNKEKAQKIFLEKLDFE